MIGKILILIGSILLFWYGVKFVRLLRRELGHTASRFEELQERLEEAVQRQRGGGTGAAAAPRPKRGREKDITDRIREVDSDD